MWFMDSDAVLSPLYLNQSLADHLHRWTISQDTAILVGQKDVRKSSMIFFNNFPWRDDMPCAGIFLLHTDKLSLVLIMLSQWWDYNLPAKNFKHFHEQDALWHILEHEYQAVNHIAGSSSDRLPDGNFALNSNSYISPHITIYYAIQSIATSYTSSP